MRSATPTAAQQDEFVRFQLRFDVLLPIPLDENPSGPIGAVDEQLNWGLNAMRFYFSGAYFCVREYMRHTIEPLRDSTLSLADSVAGMTRVVGELEAMSDAAREEMAGVMFRARRYYLQRANSDGQPRRLATSSECAALRPSQDGVQSTGSARLDGGGYDAEFAYELHAVTSAITQLRDVPDGSLPQDAGDGTTPSSAFRLIARAWTVFYATAVAHMMGGPASETMAEVADYDISPQACLRGLERLRGRIAALTPSERQEAFELIDIAFHQYIPEFEFHPANDK